jgi:dTDP-4-amino-4,6-dideoxygalactose transaminase
MFYQLPPVGNPVYLRDASSDVSLPPDIFSPFGSRYFDSGTAALAAAVIVAIRMARQEHPEVIIPAYGCPDLVSAVLYAKAKPVLVDLQPERPWMDLNQLSSRISVRTVAIIAVDLLGIPERMVEIRALADNASVLLIEDSAQAFPVHDTEACWSGDLVVLSFGRGKPVNLLGGGAVLYRDMTLGNALAKVAAKPRAARIQNGIFRVKTAIYNRLRSPRLYWLLQDLPFLHLGETHFRPLTGISGMDQYRIGLLPANIEAYRDFNANVQSAIADMVAELADSSEYLVNLPDACGIPRNLRLLRYPLLTAPDQRDRIYGELRQAGMGPSIMYPTSLPDIPGLNVFLGEQGGCFPIAGEFAARILTLPTHNRVAIRDISRIREIFGS